MGTVPGGPAGTVHAAHPERRPAVRAAAPLHTGAAAVRPAAAPARGGAPERAPARWCGLDIVRPVLFPSRVGESSARAALMAVQNKHKHTCGISITPQIRPPIGIFFCNIPLGVSATDPKRRPRSLFLGGINSFTKEVIEREAWMNRKSVGI